MTITGVFDDTFENRYHVYIKDTVSTDQSTYTIGENGLYFTDDPISIECENEDNFEHIIRKSANINLYTDNYIGHRLFAGNTNITVNILKNGTPIFAGVVLPVSFSQEYSQLHDSFTLNCVDFLTTIKYTNYKGATAGNYNNLKLSADSVSFGNFISGIVTPIMSSENITGQEYTPHIYYDRSKGITSADTVNTLYQMSISEQVLFGEDFKAVMTNEEVLEEMLKFLNLHIHQDGFDFYVYDWDSIKQQTRDWCDLISLSTVTMPSGKTIELTDDIWMSDSTNLTVADVYNQVSVKAELDDQEELITAPLDSDMLYNLFGKRTRYLRSYISWGTGESAAWGMYQMLYQNGYTDYEAAQIYDYFIEVKNNPYWKCYIDSGVTTIDTIYPQDSAGNYVNQTYVPQYMRAHSMCPAILSIGRQINGKYQMGDKLVIPIWGNYVDGEGSFPQDNDIKSHYGMIEYVGNQSGGVYSPADDTTTNYIVFGGSFYLNVFAPKTGFAHQMRTYPQPDFDDWRDYWGHLWVVSPQTNGNCFHALEMFDDSGNTVSTETIEPYCESIGCWPALSYNYSAVGDPTDRIGKLPLLECEMIIGNKRLVETYMDTAGNSTFEWITLGNEPYWRDQSGNIIYEDGEPVKKTTFTLGVNPAIGDWIIARNHGLQNTVPADSNIDTQGTAIPIKKSDNLSGPVIFRILGPVNNIWHEVRITREPSFWNHTEWGDNWRSVLARVETMFLEDFTCKIYTDAVNNINTSPVDKNSDLVYVSAETNRFIEKKDDITFKFCTQITAKEAQEKGLTLSVYMNSVIGEDMGALTSIYNARTNENAKAEEHYVDQYYREYSSPKLLLECDLKDEDIDFRNLYYNHNLNKTFYLLSVGYEGTNGSRHVKLKEL